MSEQMIAEVAFYIKFPPGVALGVTDTIDKTLLVDIVNGSQSRISRAINKVLLSVKVYVEDISTTTRTSTTETPTRNNDGGLSALIGGSVAGAVIFIIVVVVIIIVLIKRSVSCLCCVIVLSRIRIFVLGSFTPITRISCTIYSITSFSCFFFFFIRTSFPNRPIAF